MMQLSNGKTTVEARGDETGYIAALLAGGWKIVEREIVQAEALVEQFVADESRSAVQLLDDLGVYRTNDIQTLETGGDLAYIKQGEVIAGFDPLVSGDEVVLTPAAPKDELPAPGGNRVLSTEPPSTGGFLKEPPAGRGRRRSV